ncbi:hypothetical protein ACJJTC_014444 [Scirpophaga incertulas]
MASLILEGEFEGISSKQLQFIRDVLNKRGYKENKVVFSPVGSSGDNYLANIKRVKVVSENGDFYMIAKIAPNDKIARELTMTDITFNNEIQMYSKVLPKFASLQQMAQVKEEDKLRFAECYGCFNEKPYEVVLLEDLKQLDVSLFDKFKPISVEAVMLALKNLALLHSLSYALKKLEPDTYNAYKSKLIDMWATAYTRPNYDSFADQIETNTIAILDNDLHKNAVKGSITESVSACQELIKQDANSKHLVIEQGDAWTNNIMFKIENEKPIECIIIDYQLSKEACPVSDILYMLFNCTDHESRTKYFYDWLDFYYDELDRSLNYFGMKASCEYPREQLDVDLKRYCKVHFGRAIIVSSIILMKADEAAKMKEAMTRDQSEIEKSMTVTGLSAGTIVIIKKKIEGIIDSCRQLNLF